MSSNPLLPIHSSLAQDPALRERIDRFVIGLSERIDDLQDAESQRDFELISKLSDALLHDAEVAGYGQLAGIAKTLGVACIQRDARSTHLSLVELTELVHRVRLGHKGAA